MSVKAVKNQVLIHPTPGEEHTANIFRTSSWPSSLLTCTGALALHSRTCSFQSCSENTYNNLPTLTLFINCTLFSSPSFYSLPFAPYSKTPIFSSFPVTPQIKSIRCYPNPLYNPRNHTDLDNKEYFYSAPTVVTKIHTALLSLSSPPINEERQIIHGAGNATRHSE